MIYIMLINPRKDIQEIKLMNPTNSFIDQSTNCLAGRLGTCAEREAGLLAHVAQADRHTVAAPWFQALQKVLHRVVAAAQLVVQLPLTDHVTHVDHVGLAARTAYPQAHMHKHTHTYTYTHTHTHT